MKTMGVFFAWVFFLTLAAATLIVGCPKPTPSPVPPDSGDAAPVDALGPVTPATACGNLRRFACPEGQTSDAGQSCEQVLQHVIDTHLTNVDLACMTYKQTVPELRTCAGIGPTGCP